MKEIIHGLNCSPFEASAVLEAVYNVFGDYFDSSDNLKPGQIRVSIVSIEANSGQRLSHAKQVTDTLTLTDVAQETNHSIWAVDRYIKDFNRVRLCHQDGKDREFISLATGLNKIVVNEYLKIIKNSTNCP